MCSLDLFKVIECNIPRVKTITKKGQTQLSLIMDIQVQLVPVSPLVSLVYHVHHLSPWDVFFFSSLNKMFANLCK